VPQRGHTYSVIQQWSCTFACLQCDDVYAGSSGKGARHPHYEVLSVESLTELERKKSNMMLMGLQSGSSKSPSSPEIQTPQEADADADDSGKTQFIVTYFEFRSVSFRCVLFVLL